MWHLLSLEEVIYLSISGGGETSLQWRQWKQKRTGSGVANVGFASRSLF